jgi:hypothetical protein
MERIDMKRITQAEAKTFCQSLGMTFRKTECGDFRVAFLAAGRYNENSAYYTDDIEDACNTAYSMANDAKRIGVIQDDNGKRIIL